MKVDEKGEEGRWMKIEDGSLTRLYMCKLILSTGIILGFIVG